MAALLVVFIHSAPLFPISPALNQVIGHGVGRLAVPFFFIATGYFSATALVEDRWRWARRIAAMYLLWTLVYAPLWLIKSPDAVTALGHIVFGFRHLWYLPALLLGGLTLSYAARLGTRRLLGLAVLVYLAGAALQYGLNARWDWVHLAAPDLAAQIPRNFLTFAFPFLTLGYVIRVQDAAIRRVPPVWLGLAYAAATLAFALEYALVQHFYGSNRMADIYVVLIVLAPLIFAGLLRLPSRPIALPLGDTATSLYFNQIYLLAIGHTVLGFGNVGMFVFAVAGGLALTPVLRWLSYFGPFLGATRKRAEPRGPALSSNLP